MIAWPDWLKVIQLKPRFLFAFWLLGGLILFMPSKMASTFCLTDLRHILGPWIGLGTLAAFTFWLVQLIPECRERLTSRQYRRHMIRALDYVSPEEWTLLAYCLKQNQQTITLSLADRFAGSLSARGILQRSGAVGNITAWPHTIPIFLWEHLLKNRDQFITQAPFPSAEVQDRLLGLHQHIHRHDF